MSIIADDILNPDKQGSAILKILLEELSKGNISVLDNGTRDLLSQASQVFLRIDDWTPDLIQQLKYLLMICNLLYNRTDMLVLPVEDGVYDLLLETYKKFDPNFQVGSLVVQFNAGVEKELKDKGEEKAVDPIYFINKPKDEDRQYFEKQITRFDNHDRYNSAEIFPRNPLTFYTTDAYISKREHNTKHNHPDLVGTLDKCKFVLNKDAIEKDVFDQDDVKVLERDFFGKHIQEGIITPNQEIELVLELKYDGISVEADCDSIVESARTRGDTGIGEAADITPILKGYPFPRNTVLKDRLVGVKFEAIMSKTNLAKFNEARGYHYANCRTAIIGLFGASDANLFRDYITLVPLAVDRTNVPEVSNRMEEIELLNSLYKTKGEPLRYCYIKGNVETCLYLIKKFAEEAEFARSYLDFMFDGIVISYLDENIRAKLGRKNFINKYSMAVKFNPLEKLTTFLGYTFEVGQTGNICPMIHYSPVEFFGTIHPKSSGASLNRFNELALRPGDIIAVTYTNDVMPYVTKVDCEQNRSNTAPLCEFPKVCPICGTPLVISSSGKSAICPNVECKGRVIARMTNMLQKLNIKGFAESTLTAIGKYTFHELIDLREEEIAPIIGPGNARNLILAIDNLLKKPTEDYRLVGSLGFSGIGPQKWKLVFKEYTLSEFMSEMIDNRSEVYERIKNAHGIGESTAEIIMNEYDYFKEDLAALLKYAYIVDSKNIAAKKQIRFTGCRNKQLEQLLGNRGYDADGNGSVTKQTDILLVPYEGFSSTKTSKVGENTMIIPIDEFMNNMSRYL